MGWQDLLQRDDEYITHPWVGGPVRHGQRDFHLNHAPREHGWYRSKVRGQKLYPDGPAEPQVLGYRTVGYLVGTLLVPDAGGEAEHVHLIEPGLDRFARIAAGRAYEGGPLIFQQQEFPNEADIFALNFYLDHRDDEKAPEPKIKGAAPALYQAIHMEWFQRAEARRRRAEIEKHIREQEEARQREERRQGLIRQLGDGAGRRQMAQVDFETAAKAALAVGSAEFLDHRAAGRTNEMAVRFRLDGRRFECTCNALTLQIIDAGVCLRGGSVVGDTLFTLESLPGVIREAIHRGVLHVFRRVDDSYETEDEEDYD